MNLLGRKLHLSAIALLVIGMAPVQLRAQITNSFTDNFNRANVANTTNGALIGAGYVITSVSGAAEFSIQSNTARTGGAAATNRVLSYQGFQAENTGGNSFTSSIVLTLGVYNQSINPGLAFNFQDANNFYYARIASQTTATTTNGILQFGQIVAGTGTSFTGVNVTGLNIETNVAYTLTIGSTNAGSFTYGLTGGSLNLSGSFTDNIGGVDFTNGYVGLYQIIGSANTQFDDFSVVTVVPEPTTASLLILCGIVGGAFLYKRKPKSSGVG
jgi:hypothetical protein